MHKRFIKYITTVLMLAVWTMGAQNPAGRPKRQSEPTSHTLRPDTLIAQASPYRAGKNFGKRIAVFGGSLSVNRESDVAKQLWASTNDFTHGRECGSWKDYTEYDGFNPGRRSTQCGGINYCIRTLLEKNPRAEIYFFTSLRFFRSDADPEAFSAYIQAQKDCCAHYGIPVLDQYHLQGVNRFNCKEFYKKDLLHMTEEGYRRIAPVQAAFLANGR